jgi:diguanylate cyclase
MRLRDDIELIRSTRTKQFVIVAIMMMSLLAVINVLTLQTAIFYTLLACLAALIISLPMLRKGHTTAAAYLVVTVLFIGIAHAMWASSGLRSSALIGFPGVLLLCLVIIGLRSFYVAYIAMVLYMIVLSWATINGYREGSENMRGYFTTVDFVVILSGATLIIRVLGADLMNMLNQLQMELQLVTHSKTKAEHLANHDNLTGLPNRRMAEHYFQSMLSHSEVEQAGVAMVFVDVDKFKTINDSHGHQTGDDLLKHLVKTINSQLRHSDRLVRIAGDEFLILLPGIRSQADVKNILDKIYDSVQKPVTISGETLVPALSMGVVMAPAQGEDFRLLMTYADQAMYKAKANGRNQYFFYAEPL